MGKFSAKHSIARKFSIELSDKTKVNVVNYSNKFQKRLLSANVSDDLSVIISEILEVLDECVEDDINIKELPFFDVEKLFVGLYANSNKDKLSVQLKCTNVINKEEIDKETDKPPVCGSTIKTGINLNLAQVENYKKLEYLINDFKLTLRYPTFVEYFELLEMLENTAKIANDDIKAKLIKYEYFSKMINDCIVSVIDDEGTYMYQTEMDDEDKLLIIESISSQTIVQMINDIISPGLVTMVNYKCDVCGHSGTIKLKGIKNFFV